MIKIIVKYKRIFTDYLEKISAASFC